jgi:hypothetical protein
VAQLLSRDVKKHVATPRIIFGDRLREISASGGKFSLRPTELFQQQVSEARVWRGNAYCVLPAP